MTDVDIKLLEELTNEFGPSGFEIGVQKKLKKYVKKFADEIMQDRTGSLIFTLKGKTDSPKIMLAGHVDEIGFQVNGITKDGFIKFHNLGGWWDQTLLNQRVVIKTVEGNKIKGLIGAKPPHVVEASERKNVVTMEKMFIDIGCTSKKEIEDMGIRVGDPIIPDAKFEIWERPRITKEGNDEKKKIVQLAVNKAFDDRIGAVIAIEVIKQIKEQEIHHENKIYGVATTQEEVGLRGAKTASKMIKPDIGIALEVDIAGDVPGIKSNQAPAKMGKGPSLITYDRSMIPNPRLRDFIIKLAEELEIPLQLSHVKGGGTDAGVIHLTDIGCPSIVISIPTRHIHAHYGIIDLNDVSNTIKLIIEIMTRLDKKTVESFIKI